MGLIYVSEHKSFSSPCYFKRNVRADLFCCYRQAPRVCLFKVDSFQEGEADLFSTKSW